MRIALLSLFFALAQLFLSAQAPVLWAQAPDFPARRNGETAPVRLPDGRSQTEEILKDEHKRSLKDLEEIVKLAGDVKADLEKHQHHVVSMSAIKNLDEMEKRMKRVRSRLRRP